MTPTADIAAKRTRRGRVISWHIENGGGPNVRLNVITAGSLPPRRSTLVRLRHHYRVL